MLKKIALAFFVVVNLYAQINSVNVKDCGAKGDGVTLDTKAIQEAIDKSSNKGGTVYFPAGKYLTGSLELNDNADIYLSAGAVILGSVNINDYKERSPKFSSYNDYFLRHSLFYAEDKKNISIRGEGIIDGQGSAYKVTTRKKPDRYKNRPFVIRFVNCMNVKIKDITLQSSAMWMQQYLGCEDLFITGVKVYNHANQNNDMMDIDGCKNVIISDCHGDTDDDGITLKSTSPKLTENVTITNCIISSHCNALKIGTESSGGFKNIVISNILIKPSESKTVIYGSPEGTSGLTLATVDGGILTGVVISNVRIDGPLVPICLRLGNRGRKYADNAPAPGYGKMNNILLSNITADNVKSIGCSITGIADHYMENVTLSNITINYSEAGKTEDYKKEMPELEDSYPEGTLWGNLPAYGFYLRHVNNITLSDITLFCSNKEERPALIADDVTVFKLSSLKAETGIENIPFIEFRNVKNAAVNGCKPLKNVNTFLNVAGNGSKNIVINNNYLQTVKNITVVNDVDRKEIIETGNIK